MRKIVMGFAAAGIIAGSLTGAQSANAAQSNNATPSIPHNSAPVITALDCYGTTGTDLVIEMGQKQDALIKSQLGA